jgi:hypothetical protein
MAPITDNLDEDERRASVAIVRVLHSARIWQAMRDDFGMSGEQSGRIVARALGLLIDDIRRRNDEATEAGGTADD